MGKKKEKVSSSQGFDSRGRGRRRPKKKDPALHNMIGTKGSQLRRQSHQVEGHHNS